MVPKSIYLLFVLLFPLVIFSQTCVIGRWTPTKITVGADSKRLRSFYIVSGQSIHTIDKADTTCKIEKVGDMYFAIAGAPDALSRKISRESCIKEKTLSNAFLYFKDKMRAELMKFWDSVRIDAINSKQPFLFTSQVGPAAIMFFGFENHKPLLKIIYFFPISTDINKSIGMRLMIVPIPGDKYQPIPIAIGHYDGIPQYTLESTWAKDSADKVIKTLIEAQAKVTPESVGTPIDIIQVTDGGYKWLTKRRKVNKIDRQ